MYEDIVEILIKNYELMGAKMSIKLQYLRSHLDYILDNCEDYSQEQEKRFH